MHAAHVCAVCLQQIPCSKTLRPQLLQGLDCVFYGDSITESLRGTQMGVKIEKFVGIPEVFQKHYGHVRAAAYSIAGGCHPGLSFSTDGAS